MAGYGQECLSLPQHATAEAINKQLKQMAAKGVYLGVEGRGGVTGDGQGRLVLAPHAMK